MPLNTSGRMLHLLTPGKIPDEESSVYTSDYAEPETIASVEEQKHYYESWLASIECIPLSEYDNYYAVHRFPELYFRTIGTGNIPLTYLFDLDASNLDKLEREIELSVDLNKHKNVRKALSFLSLELVVKVGGLSGEMIIGFFIYDLELRFFYPNRAFIDFVQKVIATEAARDPEIIVLARDRHNGELNIIDNRANNDRTGTLADEDILGTFQLESGRIVADSYRPNNNYLVMSRNNGLMQLPFGLHEYLLTALERHGLQTSLTNR